MAHSPHRRWRGHCMVCGGAYKGKIRGAGAAAVPVRVLRQLGKRRRLTNRRDNE